MTSVKCRPFRPDLNVSKRGPSEHCFTLPEKEHNEGSASQFGISQDSPYVGSFWIL